MHPHFGVHERSSPSLRQVTVEEPGPQMNPQCICVMPAPASLYRVRETWHDVRSKHQVPLKPPWDFSYLSGGSTCRGACSEPGCQQRVGSVGEGQVPVQPQPRVGWLVLRPPRGASDSSSESQAMVSVAL